MENHKPFLVYHLAPWQWLGKWLSMPRVIPRILLAGESKHKRTERVPLAIIKVAFCELREILVTGVKGTVGARILFIVALTSPQGSCVWS